LVIAWPTFRIAFLMAVFCVETLLELKLFVTELSWLQYAGHHSGVSRKSSTHVCTMLAKLKLLPPIDTATSLTLWVAAKCCSISACPSWPPEL
jgi:hypothetical protein